MGPVLDFLLDYKPRGLNIKKKREKEALLYKFGLDWRL